MQLQFDPSAPSGKYQETQSFIEHFPGRFQGFPTVVFKKQFRCRVANSIDGCLTKSHEQERVFLRGFMQSTVASRFASMTGTHVGFE